MACPDYFLYLDDQNYALQIQLGEIHAQYEGHRSKWHEESPPDFVLAFNSFEAELKKCIDSTNDEILAHSMSAAVEADSEAIEELNLQEMQAVNDRRLALGFDEYGPMPSSAMLQVEPEPINYEKALHVGSDDGCGAIAGPSGQHSNHQDIVVGKGAIKSVECVVCGEPALAHNAVNLECGDTFCRSCLKSFFMRVARDETLFPPKCHRQAIDISVIEEDFSPEELKVYRTAELEFSSTDRIYCANLTCGVFIPAHQRNADGGSCDACTFVTCIRCKLVAHDGSCSMDESKQELLELARGQGWMECFGCGEMIFRYEGCNHMTCRCGAEFCYRCGVKWKDCDCGDWEPELLDQRAQQVVDREAGEPLAPAVRQQRVAFMARELRANHECNHGGKFRKVEFEWTRRGRACELCGTRHRIYLLSCKGCHLLACEDCRRHRV